MPDKHIEQHTQAAADVAALLTSHDAAAACACAESIAAESRRSSVWYPCLDVFFTLLEHKNSLVRNRAIAIISANARWDTDGRFAALLKPLLSHITDEKPITARVCIQALPEIAAAQPQLIPVLRKALETADFSPYRDSMQPLLLRDAQTALQKMEELLK